MGLIGIIKPLYRYNVLSSAVNKYQQHQVKNSWERRESNPWQLGEKQDCYLCDMQPPSCCWFVWLALTTTMEAGNAHLNFEVERSNIRQLSHGWGFDWEWAQSLPIPGQGQKGTIVEEEPKSPVIVTKRESLYIGLTENLLQFCILVKKISAPSNVFFPATQINGFHLRFLR